MVAAERNDKIKDIKIEFYDGLIGDLMNAKAYSLSQIIQSEKAREKFGDDVKDDLISLEIFAHQFKLDEFRSVWKELFGEESNKYDLTAFICEEMSHNLVKFTREDHKTARLEMTDQLHDQIIKHGIFMSDKLFYSLVYLYTESQQW